MLPGNCRDIGRSGRAAAAARVQEWEPLLEILRTADSAVGAAVHWVESRGVGRYGRHNEGRDPGRGSEAKKRRIQDLWRLVPELLMSDVVYVEEAEKGAEEEEEKEKAKGGGHLGNCLWLQTLPSVVQANILTFLSVAHWHFHAKDLELLARYVLRSPVNPEFWVLRAASTLLSTSLNKLRSTPSSANGIVPGTSSDGFVKIRWPGDSTVVQKYLGGEAVIEESSQRTANIRQNATGVEDYNALPDWLEKYSKPQSHPVSATELPSNSRDTVMRGADSGNGAEQQVTPEEHTKCPVDHNYVPNSPGQTAGNHLPPQAEDATLSTESKSVGTTKDGEENHDQEAMAQDMSSTSSITEVDQLDAAVRAELGDIIYAQALCLRDALHSCQATGLPKEISLLKSTPNLESLLSVIRAWEADDEVTLLLVRSLVTEMDGYARSTKILQSIILPKLVHLETPASRIMVSAIMHAGKTHPKASMDAMAFPLICARTGPNNAQCDVLSRLVKDCFPDEVNSTLCEKLFMRWNPPEYKARVTGSWLWTEGMVSVVHNLFSSQKLEVDERAFAGLVSALEVVASEYPTSVRLANLLLKLLTKYGTSLKPHKACLQIVLERSKTFLSKSLSSKFDTI